MLFNILFKTNVIQGKILKYLLNFKKLEKKIKIAN